MNVYDFDDTLYNGDSSIDFVRYCIRKQPFSVLRLVPAVFALGMYLAKIWSKERFKSAVFAVVCDLDDIMQTVNKFWDIHRVKIGKTALGLPQSIDVIISASPEFLLAPVADEMGATLIASCVDPQTGKWLGANCRGEEKVRRFRELYGESEIKRFYSDNLSDEPMAALAQEAWMVKKGAVESWTKIQK